MQNWTSLCRSEIGLEGECSWSSMKSGVINTVDFILKDLGKSQLSDVTDEQFYSSIIKFNKTTPDVYTYFDRYFSESNFTISYIRTFIYFAYPLNIDGIKFKNSTDR